MRYGATGGACGQRSAVSLGPSCLRVTALLDRPPVCPLPLPFLLREMVALTLDHSLLQIQSVRLAQAG